MKFRFKIAEPEKEPIFTEWFDEAPGATVNMAAGLRRVYPDASLAVERSQKIPMPNDKLRKEIEERWIAKRTEELKEEAEKVNAS